MGGVTRAYARISLAAERSGSITKQRERLAASEVAAGRDPEGIEWYVDEGVSASRDVARPGRDRLVADLGPGDRVVVTKIDRLARNVADLLSIVKAVDDAGASIRFVDSDINTAGPYGRFMLTLLGAVAELEANIISERQRESRESFLKNGRHPAGKVPYGFRAVPNPKGAGFVIEKDPDTAPLVRAAVLRVLAGESQNTVRESVGLSKTGFHKMLLNPRLAGMTPDGGGVVTVNGVPRVNPDAAILSMTEWRKLNEFMSDRPNKAWSRQEGFGRVLRCGYCGERMYRNLSRRSEDYATYRCRKTKHTPDQPGLSVMVKAADEFIESEFLAMFGDVFYRVKSWEDDDAARTEALSLAQVRISEVQRRMAETNDPETLAALAADLVKAHNARAEAESMPTTVREVFTDTGRTFREVFREADDAFKERAIGWHGHFVVTPAKRGTPVEERLKWDGYTPPPADVQREVAETVLERIGRARANRQN